MRRTVLTFVATALSGLVVWVLTNSAVAGALFGLPAYRIFYYSSPLLDLLGPPLAALTLATVVGYVSPRHFWLWGLAVVSLRPLVSIYSYTYAARAGVIGPSSYTGLAIVETMFFFTYTVLCTLGSGVGASLRLLVGRIRSTRG